MRWKERRERIYGLISSVFSAKTAIGREDFENIYIRAESPPPISDFESQYVPDHETLSEILEDLADRTGIDPDRVEAHYDRRESFVQFAEHLLRVKDPGKGDAS